MLICLLLWPLQAVHLDRGWAPLSSISAMVANVPHTMAAFAATVHKDFSTGLYSETQEAHILACNF